MPLSNHQSLWSRITDQIYSLSPKNYYAPRLNSGPIARRPTVSPLSSGMIRLIGIIGSWTPCLWVTSSRCALGVSDTLEPEWIVAWPTGQSIGSAYGSAGRLRSCFCCSFCCCGRHCCCFQLCMVVDTDPTVVWSRGLLTRHSLKASAQVVVAEGIFWERVLILAVGASLRPTLGHPGKTFCANGVPRSTGAILRWDCFPLAQTAWPSTAHCFSWSQDEDAQEQKREWVSHARADQVNPIQDQSNTEDWAADTCF